MVYIIWSTKRCCSQRPLVNISQDILFQRMWYACPVDLIPFFFTFIFTLRSSSTGLVVGIFCHFLDDMKIIVSVFLWGSLWDLCQGQMCVYSITTTYFYSLVIVEVKLEFVKYYDLVYFYRVLRKFRPIWRAAR